MGYSIFFQAVDSTDGFQSEVIRAVDERLHPDRILMTVKTDGRDVFDDERYTAVNYDICEQNRYSEIVDMDSLTPLSREILEAMKPYELTAIRMLCRNYERDIYTMDESMRFYLRHLRYWNHMFITHGINFAFFTVTPHHTHDYVIYALAKVYGIKTYVSISTNFQYRYFLARSLDNAHNETYEIYEKKYRDMPPEDIELPEDVETYYSTILNGTKEQMRAQALQGTSQSMELREKRDLFETDLSLKRVVRKSLSDFKHHYLKAKNREEAADTLGKIRFRLALQRRDWIKQKFMVGIDYYDSIATLPKEGEAYVVYYLHYQPEATTLPQGGVFNDQELAVAILAKAAQGLGIKLYVKEHFVQYRRMKTFYDDIAAIPNVTLIKSSVNSRDLSEGSVCAATGNGTVVLESVIRGTPIIVFGETGFGLCPGVHMVGSVEEAAKAIETARTEREEGIPRQLIRAYLAAFAENSLYSRVYANASLSREDPYFGVSRDCLVDVICKKIG